MDAFILFLTPDSILPRGKVGSDKSDYAWLVNDYMWQAKGDIDQIVGKRAPGVVESGDPTSLA